MFSGWLHGDDSGLLAESRPAGASATINGKWLKMILDGSGNGVAAFFQSLRQDSKIPRGGVKSIGSNSRWINEVNFCERCRQSAK